MLVYLREDVVDLLDEWTRHAMGLVLVIARVGYNEGIDLLGELGVYIECGHDLTPDMDDAQIRDVLIRWVARAQADPAREAFFVERAGQVIARLKIQ